MLLLQNVLNCRWKKKKISGLWHGTNGGADIGGPDIKKKKTEKKAGGRRIRSKFLTGDPHKSLA